MKSRAQEARETRKWVLGAIGAVLSIGAIVVLSALYKGAPQSMPRPVSSASPGPVQPAVPRTAPQTAVKETEGDTRTNDLLALAEFHRRLAAMENELSNRNAQFREALIIVATRENLPNAEALAKRIPEYFAYSQQAERRANGMEIPKLIHPDARAHIQRAANAFKQNFQAEALKMRAFAALDRTNKGFDYIEALGKVQEQYALEEALAIAGAYRALDADIEKINFQTGGLK